jgi:hypothetical protein
VRYRILKRASPPQQQATPFWPNWPQMNAICLQGNISNTLLDESTHSMLADKDLVIIQSHYENTTRHTSRKAAIAAVRALQSAPMRTKFYLYVLPSVSVKNFPATPGQNEKELTKELIESATEGNLRWYVHRVGGGTSQASRIEDYFDESGATWQNNVAARTTDRNSLNEYFHQAYWRKKDQRLSITPDLRPDLDGFFMDVSVVRPTPWWINDHTSTVNDADLDYDGVGDSRTSWAVGAGAGGRMWAEGQLLFKAEMESRFPGKYMIPNAPWDQDYFDGGGVPALPMSNHPFYRQWEMPLDEVANFSLGLRIATGGTTYNYTGGGSASSYYRAYYIQEKFVKLDEDQPEAIGKGCVLMHAHAIARAPISTDVEFMRTTTLMCLLVERAAHCIQQGGARAFSLDEQLVELGSPINARTMGTFNEITLNWPGLRTANQSVGVARFYWAEFQKAIVVCRLDNPTIGVWPSADAAVTCTLPPAGVGKKWQMLNASNYVNPITGRATRNQTPALNNGADVTTVSLRPFHCALVRRVDA